MAIHLNAGADLNGYRLTTDMTASDAGTSMWALAEKSGFEYFVKCFLTPVYPRPDGPGSEVSKQRKRARCEAFELRIQQVDQVLELCGSDSFLVRSVDFFRQDGSYFKITKKIVAKKIGIVDLPARAQLLILLSAAYSLKILHENSDFVHADIKPENFMVQRAGERLIANLIDFDAGFFMGHPPDPEDLTGDQRYWSPELIEFLGGSDTQNRGTALLQSLDIFSLGATFCEYLCGRLPEFPSEYMYVGEAVLDGAPVKVPAPRHAEFAPLVPMLESMLQKTPAKRPDSKAVHETLRELNKQLFVNERTYEKMAGSLLNELLSRGQSLRDLALFYGAKTLNKHHPGINVRGLKTDRKRRLSKAFWKLS